MAGNLELQLGGFFPNAGSGIFSDDSQLYDIGGRAVQKSDWQGWAGGIEYSGKVAPYFEVGVSLDAYGRTLRSSYLNYTNPDGSEIQQSLNFNEVPLGISFRVIPTSRHAVFAPFAEVGADVIFYEYKEYGNFINFQSSNLAIYPDSFRSSGSAPGVHVGAGIRVRVGDDVSLVARYKYLFAHDTMGGAFNGDRIDLSGGLATFGVNFRF